MKTVALYGKRIMRFGNMGRIFNIDVAKGQPPTGTNGKRRPGGRGRMIKPIHPSSFEKKGPRTERPEGASSGAGAGS
jgi:hypothetical protein